MQKQFKHETAMPITAVRKQTSFRFHPGLMDALKERAAERNKSLNGYVEMLLMDAIYNEPNEETQAAIEESRQGIFAGTVDTSSPEAFRRSLGI